MMIVTIVHLASAAALSVAVVVTVAAGLRWLAGYDSDLRYRTMRMLLFLLLLIPLQLGWIASVPRSWSPLPASFALAPRTPAGWQTWLSTAPGLPSSTSSRLARDFRSPKDNSLHGARSEHASGRPTRATIVMVSYFVGASMALGLFAVGIHRTFRILSRARPIADPRILELWTKLLSRKNLLGKAALWESDNVSSPSCWGWRRFRVLLPAGRFQRLSDASLECVLRHELAHLERRDPLVALLAAAIGVVYWCHPCVWWFLGALRRDCESSCDASVVRATRAPRTYALAILEVIESDRLKGRTLGLDLLPSLGTCRSLKRRLTMIGYSSRVAGRVERAVIAVVFAVAAALLMAWQSSAALWVAPPKSSTAASDAAPEVDVKIETRDGDRVTRVMIESAKEGRSAKQVLASLEALYRANPQSDGRVPTAGSITMQESLLQSTTARLVDGALESDNFDLYLPEGSGMNAIIEGEEVLVDHSRKPLVISVKAGCLQLIQADNNVTRVKVSPAIAGAELRLETQLTKGEVQFHASATSTKDALVHVKLDLESNLQGNDGAPPHGAVRWSLLPRELSEPGKVQLKMQWFYDISELHRQAKPSPAN